MRQYHRVRSRVYELFTPQSGDTLGQLFAGVIALLGIGLFALPAAILASGFLEQAAEAAELDYCPHCGERLDRERDRTA